MIKKSFKSFVGFGLLLIFAIISFSCSVINPISLKNTQTTYCYSSSAYLPKFSEILKSLFKKKSNLDDEPPKEKVMVYVGGYPLGFTLSCSGVVVVASSNETAKNILAGDIITHIEDHKISSAEQILKLINTKDYAGKNLTLTVLRKGNPLKVTLTPIFDNTLKLYKLGLWIRDDAAGVGTLTYIRADNKRFGALGHPVCDIDTGSVMPVSDGNIFKCSVVGYKKGIKGNPGELKGLFLRTGKMLGELDKNNGFGVFGTFGDDYIAGYNEELVEVASKSEIKTGKATLRCTIDGLTPKDYEIEIVKAYFQNKKDNKSMFIRVTDKELISKTGGIVQGMSGSPILQNGKLVGAVTHVFVNDPTKGYAVFAEYMTDN